MDVSLKFSKRKFRNNQNISLSFPSQCPLDSNHSKNRQHVAFNVLLVYNLKVEKSTNNNLTMKG